MIRISWMLVCLAVFFHLSAKASENLFTVECRNPGSLTEAVVGGKPALSIQGTGIGNGTVKLKTGAWPEVIVLRAYFRGLESLTVTAGSLKWTAELQSHGDHRSLLTLWEDGKQRPGISSDSPYWTEVRCFDSTGKPVTGLPEAGGWVELRIPGKLIDHQKSFQIAWIDFYR